MEVEQTPMSDKVKERIEKDAEAYHSGVFPKIHYIAGATAERPIAWNEAIDECASAFGGIWINATVRGLKVTPDEVLKALEALKHKQP